MAYVGYTAVVDGVCNNATKWTVELTTDLLDATTFCSVETGGDESYKEQVEGLKGGTYTIEALAPLSIGDGASISLKNDAVTISGVAFQSSATYDTSVEGLCTFVYKGNFSATISVT